MKLRGRPVASGVPAPHLRRLDEAEQFGVDWWRGRVVISQDIPDGMAAVSAYSFADMIRAHAMLDAMDGLRADQSDDMDRDLTRARGDL